LSQQHIISIIVYMLYTLFLTFLPKMLPYNVSDIIFTQISFVLRSMIQNLTVLPIFFDNNIDSWNNLLHGQSVITSSKIDALLRSVLLRSIFLKNKGTFRGKFEDKRGEIRFVFVRICGPRTRRKFDRYSPGSTGADSKKNRPLTPFLCWKRGDNTFVV
jgi:hypothetical protein